MDKALLMEIVTLGNAGDLAALVTIIGTKGSTPRKAGTKMIVYADGRVSGTIGGGCAEAEVRLKALQVLDARQSVTHQVSMLGEAAADEGMACGGTMDVFIQVL